MHDMLIGWTVGKVEQLAKQLLLLAYTLSGHTAL